MEFRRTNRFGVAVMFLVMTCLPGFSEGTIAGGHSGETIAGRKPKGRELSFSAADELSTLAVSKQRFEKGYSGGTAETKTVTFKIDPSQCSLHRMGGGYDYLKVGHLKPGTNPGEPQLPMKVFTVTLPVETEILGVEVIDGNYVSIEKELNIAPTPQPVPISRYKGNRVMIPDKGIYSLKSYFPGNFVSYYTGTDKEARYVFVRFFPVQYIPRARKAILVTSATIVIYYGR